MRRDVLLILALSFVKDISGISFNAQATMRLRSGRTLAGNVANDTVNATEQNIESYDIDAVDRDSSLDVSVDGDGDNFSPISKCGKCVTCNKGFLDTNPYYVNQVTGEKFTVTDHMSCKSTNIIYLIRCAHPDCCLQYIGKSINSCDTITNLQNGSCLFQFCLWFIIR